MNLLKKFTGGDAEVEIFIDEKRKRSGFRDKSGEMIKLPTFYDKENLSGKVVVTLTNTKKLEHQGIKIEIIGTIDLTGEKKSSSAFISLTRELEPQGSITKDTTSLDFSFNNVEKQFESYRGNGVQVRYFLKVTITKKFGTVTKEQDFLVLNPVSMCLDKKDPVKNEVGIEDWLHLGFEFEKSKYNLKDMVKGVVVFKKVSIRLKSMELQIIKRETLGAGATATPDNEVITKFEIMDGGPIKNETIPIKFYLNPYELTPTYNNVNNKFSVQYFLNLVLVDVDERRYFKQHEITMVRLASPTSNSSDN